MSETVIGEGGMVTAPHRLASEIGAEVLRAGGNALEAMVAMAATIAVVYPHMNGIGGDVFALISEPGKPPRAIDASGKAGSGATRERYTKAGHDVIPARGAGAAVTVAGTVSGWVLMLEAAAALGGRMPLGELLADAIGRARSGVPVTRSQAVSLAERADVLAGAPGFAAVFMPDGKAPDAGDLMVQERLADTLDRLAHAGLADFYRGDIAATLASDLEVAGAPVTREDLRAHEARLVKPLTLPLDGVTLFNTPPPTQGVASLILLGLFDRLKATRPETFAFTHGLIEAAKRAKIVRDAEVADPFHAGDVAPYLEAEWLDAEALTIDAKRASPWPLGGAKGDTVWMGAIDGKGVAVSFIQSIFHAFGSGVVSPRTGVLWHNRGASFSLDPKSRNVLAPGKKPLHTLNPPLARFADGRTMVYGAMGGDAQPQFQAQVFARYRGGVDPGEAIARPRWRLGSDAGEAELTMEDRFDPDLVEELTRAGHVIDVLPVGYSDDMGHAGAIVRRADGRLSGASDPRADGAAMAVR